MSDRFLGPSPKRYFWTPRDLSMKTWGNPSVGAAGDPRSYEYFQRGWLEKSTYGYTLFPTSAKTPFSVANGDYVLEPQFKLGTNPPGHNYIGMQTKRFVNGLTGPFGDSNALAIPPNSPQSPAVLGWNRGARPTPSGVIMACWFRVCPKTPDVNGVQAFNLMNIFSAAGDVLYMDMQVFSGSVFIYGTMFSAGQQVGASTNAFFSFRGGWGLMTMAIYPTGDTTYQIGVTLTGMGESGGNNLSSFDTAVGDPPIDWLDSNPTTNIATFGSFGGLISRPVFAVADGNSSVTSNLYSTLTLGGIGAGPQTTFGGVSG